MVVGIYMTLCFPLHISNFISSILLHGVRKSSVIGFGFDGLVMILVFWHAWG